MKNNCAIILITIYYEKKLVNINNILKVLFRIKTRKIPRPISIEKANTENTY